jgi:hypothetical protein
MFGCRDRTVVVYQQLITVTMIELSVLAVIQNGGWLVVYFSVLQHCQTQFIPYRIPIY